jgi:hypothetical protein
VLGKIVNVKQSLPLSYPIQLGKFKLKELKVVPPNPKIVDVFLIK